MPGRVLFVAYNFPPIGGVGIQRTLKHATYLPRFGWQPVVLTARDPGWGVRDAEAEMALPPELVVERAFSPEPVKLRRLLGRALRPLRGRRKAAGAGGAAGVGAGGAAGVGAGVGAGGAAGGAAGVDPDEAVGGPVAADRASGSLVRPPGPLTRRALAVWGTAARWTFYPDEQVGWVPFAVRRGLALHREAPFDAVYSSSPPISSHLAAALIARRAGVPWVADFRDPWIGNAFAAPPPPHHRYFQKRIERRIARIADVVVMATDGLAKAFTTRYPEAATRCVAIPNGYDRADLPPGATASARPKRSAGRSGGRFRLVYGGSLYGADELRVFLDGLELLLARRPELRRRLAVEFVGQVNVENRLLAAAYATPERLGSVVTYTGFLPHKEALRRMLEADALLQLIAAGPGKSHVQGGKLMEYVGLDRPILAVVPEGDARAMLAELGWGIVADPTPEGVAGGMERLLAEPAPARRADPEGRYDRINLAARLAGVLDGAVTRRAPGADRGPARGARR
jgi:glycosyltransferase involved in cell wall biosynthesis